MCQSLPFRGLCAILSSLEKGYSQDWLFWHMYMFVLEISRLTTLHNQLPSLGTETWTFIFFDLRTDTTVISIMSLAILSVLFFTSRTDYLGWMTACWPWGSCGAACVCLFFKLISSMLWRKGILDITFTWSVDLNNGNFSSMLHFSTQLYELWRIFFFFLGQKLWQATKCAVKK